jgi:hypothetical protein
MMARRPQIVLEPADAGDTHATRVVIGQATAVRPDALGTA